MKLKYNIAFLAVAIAMAGILTNCSDEDSGGAPRVSYVRITEPASSDSLLVAAAQGQMVAIMGDNLQHTVELWVNDRQAALTTTFITNTSIITRVPAELPEVITNQVKLVFSNGESLIYDFSVDISAPFISRIKSEYVNTGDVATFFGDYFYPPLVVTFTGGAQAEIASVEDQVLNVVVPDGVQPGPVTIASNFGITETDFWFRDNRNIIASFDVPIDPNPSGEHLWHGEALFTSSDPDISSVQGNFVRVNQDLGPWAWYEMYVGTASDNISTKELKNIPLEAFEKPDQYLLKLELNTLAPLGGANIRMYIGPDMPGERGTYYYNWTPNTDTGGDWETVSIPWKDFLDANETLVYNPAGYGISMHFSGPNAVIANFGLDNMRVVPMSAD